MHQTIYRRHCRHRIPEYTVPFSEREVACHNHAPALVPLGEEVEEDFHFFRGLLHVPDVVKDHDVEPVEFGFGNANLITRESRILTTAINLPRLPF